MYNTTNPTSKYRWNNVLTISENEWIAILKLPFVITKETQLQWFQTRINHCILGTNILLHKINNTHTDICSFCKDSIETIEDLNNVKNILINFETTLNEHNIF